MTEKCNELHLSNGQVTFNQEAVKEFIQWTLWLPFHVIMGTGWKDPAQEPVKHLELGMNKLHHTWKVMT